MKKVALSLLALSVLAVGAFAEDAAAPAPALKFSGYYNSGLDADFTDGVGSYYAYAHDYGTAGAIGRLNGVYDATTWGFKFRFQEKDWTSISYDYAFGWVKPIDGLKIDGGLVSDGTLDQLDWNGERHLKGKGLNAYYSIAGFTAGAAAFVSSTSDDTLGAAFGAKYALDKTFAAVVSAKLADKAVDSFDVSASLDAVPGLTFTAGYVATGLATTKFDFVDVYATYAITDAFSATVLAYDYLKETSFEITPSVAYVVVPGLTAGAEVKFVTADHLDGPAGGSDTTTVVATQIPAVTCTYVVGGATVKGYAGYDLTPKTVKTYIDFLFAF